MSTGNLRTPDDQPPNESQKGCYKELGQIFKERCRLKAEGDFSQGLACPLANIRGCGFALLFRECLCVGGGSYSGGPTTSPI